MPNNFISVIMASYLSEYSTEYFKCASNRELKFKRAVNSFLAQSYTNCELIVTSDGCKKTIDILRSQYTEHLMSKRIILVELPKQALFSGRVRQAGIEASHGNLICYLDSDDIIGDNHLSAINDQFQGRWVYYDDYLYNGQDKIKRDVLPKCNSIGTSAFCHAADINLVWCDGYGHDWKTISSIIELNPTKIQGTDYMVCHIPGEIDY